MSIATLHEPEADVTSTVTDHDLAGLVSAVRESVANSRLDAIEAAVDSLQAKLADVDPPSVRGGYLSQLAVPPDDPEVQDLWRQRSRLVDELCELRERLAVDSDLRSIHRSLLTWVKRAIRFAQAEQQACRNNDLTVSA